MKKTLLVFALVAIMIFAFAGTAFAKNAGSAAAAGDGYVSWSTAVGIASGQAAEAAGPHSGYTVSTVKCAVCHSIHGAPQNTWLLTKATATAGADAARVCSYCHGYGATAGAMLVAINQGNGNTNTPHSSICYQSCHAGVHGTNVSSYSMLAAKLLTKNADTLIARAIGADTLFTGLTAADFTAPAGGFGQPGNPFGTALNTYPQTAMATGYLCAQPGCHVQSAFAVKVRGDNMKVQSRSGVNDLALSGHPVVKGFNDGGQGFVFPAGSSKFGVTGLQVAYKPVGGCPTCHDLPDTGTTLGFAFPHNRTGQAGSTADQRLWLTKAPDSNTAGTAVKDADLIDAATGLPALYTGMGNGMDGTPIGLADNYVTLQDGICLKCHRSSAVVGVGSTF